MPAYTDKSDALQKALTAVQFHEGGTPHTGDRSGRQWGRYRPPSEAASA